jgi:hypothetical protein
MMGYNTAFIWMFSNLTFETKPEPLAQVFILAPFEELEIKQLVTVMFFTMSFELFFPRLPMLYEEKRKLNSNNL